MLGINGSEFIVLAILAILLLGPERIPEYASQLARLTREIKRVATGARQQLKDELGDDFEDVDWRKLDPRQYDPRRIVREALFDDETTATNGVPRPTPAPAVQASVPTIATRPGLAPGQRAPWDIDAT
ncbi:Sec-independent protein translocase TatB [Tersicoccus sp. Bi-70]|uniref:Sec-independent protein translocase TatB n=1 Tax=Tersicoccus sp. Bi-70 TaxID=1897634 RepID=UPI0009761DE8|nr:Sec-independent protein translocase TatB [Tersicoccus sp. Bi-70]OMH35108.1 preprotein translocase subunit TatA [Tersicoccus sp. Bi-70]